jgi:hypothetical protein
VTAITDFRAFLHIPSTFRDVPLRQLRQSLNDKALRAIKMLEGFIF